MAHRYHPDPKRNDHPDAIAFDGCDVCEARADAGIRGVLSFDDASIAALWDRMLVTEYRDLNAHRSRAESRLCHSLYYVAVLMERYFPETHPWERRGAADGPAS